MIACFASESVIKCTGSIAATWPCDWLRRCWWEVMDHIPDHACSDFHRFGSMKKHLAGKQFAPDADVMLPVTFWYRNWRSGATVGKCLNVSSDCLVVWCVPSAIRVSCIRRSQKEFSASEYYYLTLELISKCFFDKTAVLFNFKFWEVWSSYCGLKSCNSAHRFLFSV